MKKAVAVILILAVMGQLLNKLLVVAAFEMQESYIAQELCEKREVPQSGCHGQCQLDKKLTESTDHDNGAKTPRFEEMPNFSLYIPIQNLFSFRQNRSDGQRMATHATMPRDLVPADIFHPPR